MDRCELLVLFSAGMASPITKPLSREFRLFPTTPAIPHEKIQLLFTLHPTLPLRYPSPGCPRFLPPLLSDPRHQLEQPVRIALEARPRAAPRGGLACPRQRQGHDRGEDSRVPPGPSSVVAVDLQPPSQEPAGADGGFLPFAQGHRQERPRGACAQVSGGGGGLMRARRLRS